VAKVAPLLSVVQGRGPSAAETEMRTRLAQLFTDVRNAGIPDSVALRVMMSWAAEQAYENGGYGAAKALSLNALEELLFRASR
jgi:hypothetical protein